MSGANPAADGTRPDTLTLGVRWVEGLIDRAELRTTLMWHALPWLSAGVEYNPLSDDVGPLANLRLVSETRTRPALIVGTSSDRIGTDHGQSFYATLSKDLGSVIDLPVAPYVGASFGTFDDRLRAIGGLNIRLSESVGSLLIFDGVHVHPTLSWTTGRHVFTMLLARGTHFGLSYSIAVPGPDVWFSD